MGKNGKKKEKKNLMENNMYNLSKSNIKGNKYNSNFLLKYRLNEYRLVAFTTMPVSMYLLKYLSMN